MSISYSPLASYTPIQRDQTLEYLRYLVKFMAAAEYVDEVAVFTDFLAWLDELLHSRGVPRADLALALQAMKPELLTANPQRGRLAEEGVGYLATITG